MSYLPRRLLLITALGAAALATAGCDTMMNRSASMSGSDRSATPPSGTMSRTPTTQPDSSTTRLGTGTGGDATPGATGTPGAAGGQTGGANSR